MASPIDTDLAIRLRIAIARIGRRMRAAAVGGLTPSQLSALASLDAEGPMRNGDLAALEAVAAPSMTRIAASLEEAGLVGRSAAPDDRRCVVLHCTDGGHARLEAVAREKTAFLSARLAGLGPDLRRHLEEAVPALEALLLDEAAERQAASSRARARR
jgi:DNA-binding MarR family transcriptional regulator